ncbi:MAG: AbrB/MazE/SpoVT family DNA-binding domain-containing protein [Acetobacteraceae bacterium]|nr:AbrB/MazE/SpoVT family DNA-binding domain-containing protein [Acetobacteraceae bacterium]
MASEQRAMTTVSTKGQVILPSAIRRHRNWQPGTRLIVEETADGGVLLRPARLFSATAPQQVFGALKWEGKPKSLEEMEAGIADEAKRRHARGRY